MFNRIQSQHSRSRSIRAWPDGRPECRSAGVQCRERAVVNLGEKVLDLRRRVDESEPLLELIKEVDLERTTLA